MTNTTLPNQRRKWQRIPVINTTDFSSLIKMVLLAVVLTASFAISKTISSIVIVIGFGSYGLYNLSRRDYVAWFSVVCFFCGAESILRNGLPAGYMFFFFFLVISGFLFLLNRSSQQRFRLWSATGLILLLAILHFIHLDFHELRFGIGKWGLIWAGLFFGMWISQSIKLNDSFYYFSWYYMLGGVTVLFSFLINPQYALGRYWATFDGTGPVAASIGLLVLILIQDFNPKKWVSGKNALLGGLLALCLIAMVMLGSRGTFLGLAVAFIFFLFTIPGLWSKVLLTFAMVALVVFIYYIDQSSVGNKVLSSRVEEATQDDTREGRKFINSAVLLAFPEDPLFGKGTGSWRHFNNKYIGAVFDRTYPKDVIMTDAHNTLLHLLFEHGIIGIGLFILAMIIMIRKTYTMSKYTGIYVFPMVLFSITLGLTTMHKQAPMFLPFLIAMTSISFQKKPNERHS